MSNDNPQVKKEIEAAIRKTSPEHGAILDEIDDLKERVSVVDKRRFADQINDEDAEQTIREGREMASPEQIEKAAKQTREYFESSDGRAVVSAVREEIPSIFSPSSTPAQTPGMDFPAAMKQVMKGHRVTRLEWENPEIWLMMFYWGAINPKTPAGKYLTIHHADGAMNPLYPSDGDLLGDDWVVVV